MKSNEKITCKHHFSTGFIPLFALLIFAAIALPDCRKPHSRGLVSSDLVQVGSDICSTDRKGGIDQASPDVGCLADNIPENESNLRFKLYDDPLPNPAEGLVQYLIEYDSLKTLVFEAPAAHYPNPDQIILYIDRVEVTDTADGSLKTVRPSGRESRIDIKNSRHYIPILRGISLPPGSYENLKVWLKSEGEVVVGATKYGVRIRKRHIDYQTPFRVEQGKITALHGVPVREYGKKSSGKTGKPFSEILPPDFEYTVSQQKFNIQINIKPIGYEILKPIDQVFIRFIRLGAVDSGGANHLLNDTPTEFELLSLRDGLVALMGSNMLPAGDYSHFELALDDDNHRVEVGGESLPLTLEDRAYAVFRLMGPFELRGGRITELFIHFDPNSSIYYLPERGYILDPEIYTTSVISMSRDQHLRLTDVLGEKNNELLKTADIILETEITAVTPIEASNIYGQNIIYSRITANVLDRLRGDIDPTQQLIFNTPGGTLNGLTLHAVGMPRFYENETVLLFLNRYGDRLGVTMGELGKIRRYQ